jgi:hypothetical protein
MFMKSQAAMAVTVKSTVLSYLYHNVWKKHTGTAEQLSFINNTVNDISY